MYDHLTWSEYWFIVAWPYLYEQFMWHVMPVVFLLASVAVLMAFAATMTGFRDWWHEKPKDQL